MAGPVLDKADLLTAGAQFGIRQQFIQHIADHFHDLQIGLLIVPADIVRLPCLTARQDEAQGLGVIVDVQPVADIVSLTIYRQGLAGDGIEDHQGNQFFRKLIGTIVIGTVGDERGQAIGMMPGTDQVVRGGLAGGIR